MKTKSFEPGLKKRYTQLRSVCLRLCPGLTKKVRSARTSVRGGDGKLPWWRKQRVGKARHILEVFVVYVYACPCVCACVSARMHLSVCVCVCVCVCAALRPTCRKKKDKERLHRPERCTGHTCNSHTHTHTHTPTSLFLHASAEKAYRHPNLPLQ